MVRRVPMRARPLLLLAAVLSPFALAGAQASVTGIPELARYTTADARGRFRFDSVPAGRFTLTFLHPSLDALDVAAPIVALIVPERGTVSVPLTTPAPATLYARLCPNASDTATGFLLGRVRDVDDAVPLARAIVTAEWSEYGLERGKLKAHAARTSSATNAAGAYVLCGVPSDVESQVYVFARGYAAGPIPVSLAEQLFVHLNMAVSQRDSAARFTPEQFADTTRPRQQFASWPGRAAVTGTTRSAQGGAISTAFVGVLGASGTTHVDSAGRFRLPGVAAGTRAVQVRAIGMAPTTLALDLPVGVTVDTTIRVEQRAQTLAGVEVLGQRDVLRDRTGFEERRKVAVGRFLTAAEIERYPTTEIATALERLPALHIIVDPKDPKFRLYMRGGQQSRNGKFSNGVHMCLPNYFVDGMSFGSSAEAIEDVRRFIQVNDIRGVEVYTGGEIIPPQYDRSNINGCGSIIIWSK